MRWLTLSLLTAIVVRTPILAQTTDKHYEAIRQANEAIRNIEQANRQLGKVGEQRSKESRDAHRNSRELNSSNWFDPPRCSDCETE